MNAVNYVKDVLRPYARTFVQTLGSDFSLMHDNARSHTALQTRVYLKGKHPDIALDRTIAKPQPHLACMSSRDVF